ncbi:MAG: hypothetical protein RLZZ591_617 [Pseudomonadota bacterium]
MFKDRIEAAHQLAQKLLHYRDKRALVMGIPRGAVPMAAIIARTLNADLDVVLVRKLGAPGQPELAIGAVDESGWTYMSEVAEHLGMSPDQIEAEKQVQLQVITKRRAQYSPGHQRFDPAGRIVIVVDDGVATGSTMSAALHALRQHRPGRLICAVPVATPDTLRKMSALADEVICLQSPAYLGSVGQFYERFSQVEDDEVVSTLRSFSHKDTTEKK